MSISWLVWKKKPGGETVLSRTEYNVSHTVNHLSFGTKFPGRVNALDGFCLYFGFFLGGWCIHITCWFMSHTCTSPLIFSVIQLWVMTHCYFRSMKRQHRWVMSHGHDSLYECRVTWLICAVFIWRQMYEWVMSHGILFGDAYVRHDSRMSHAIRHVTESYHSSARVMAHVNTFIQWVLAHIWMHSQDEPKRHRMSHVTHHMNESCHTSYEWVMSPVRSSHSTYG